jgi:hypothetical protein
MRSRFPAIALLAVASAARAADPPSVRVDGFIDGDYAWSSQSHDNFIAGTGTTAERANELSLNLAAVELIKDAAPIGFHLTLVAGDGANVVHAAESRTFRHIYQASIIYKANDRLTLEGGIYPSHIGFEGFFSKDNWSYTRGWLGELSPYYQAGVRTAYQFSKQWSGELHVLNGWQTIHDSGRAVGVKVAYSGNRLSASLNTFDDRRRHFGDLIATWKATPTLSFGGSLDRGHQQHANWLGVGGYGRYAFDNRHAVAVRAEIFRDPDNGISGFAQKLTETTLTYEVRPTPNLIFKLEGRRDRSTANVFDGSKNQTLVVAGAVATF